MRPPFRPALLAAVVAAAALGACSDPSAPVGQATAGRVSLSKGRSGGGGGGDSKIDGSNFLPATPPAPGILVRESFGPGADTMRPAGDKGVMKATYTHTTLDGFWVEYPGSRDTQWLTPETGQTWKLCGGSADAYELPSPLQVSYSGCVASEWFDPPTSYPTALLPITVALPGAGYELSMDGYPAPIPGGYVAIGFTTSPVLTSNLTTSGLLWLRVTDPTRAGVPLHYELRVGSLATGRLIAAGDAGSAGWNRMALRVSPAAGTVTLTFADAVLGTFPVTTATPTYLAFEGIGILDNLVLRQ